MDTFAFLFRDGDNDEEDFALRDYYVGKVLGTYGKRRAGVFLSNAGFLVSLQLGSVAIV